MDQTKQFAIKQALGRQAASLVEDGMIVGIGSGTTATCFIESLVERVQKKRLSIQAVSSSFASAELAKKGGIPLLNEQNFTCIDLCIDGADEVAADFSLIKGGGGNLLREKIIACASREMVVIVDETKLSKTLHRHLLPIEVLPFGLSATKEHIEKMGFSCRLRMREPNCPFITDNENFILDAAHQNMPPREAEKKLKALTGVIETGFFFDIADRVLVGYSDGTTKWL